MHQLEELRHISDGIRGVRSDLETLESIILDDDDADDDLEDDYELIHMRHQLHEVTKIYNQQKHSIICMHCMLRFEVVSLIKFAKFFAQFFSVANFPAGYETLV